METSRLKREVNDLRARGGSADRMVGSSSAILNLKRIIEKLGPANSRVLISGAAGSGKELAARLIHENSARANGPFVVINAPTMSPERMEAELFGVESGVEGQARVGALEEAHGGTLYLDEIADMPRETQAKILRVLVDQNFLRVGGGSRVSVDVRIISSTSRDLAEAITEGRFREDLFHRLSVVPVRVPSLAERREDIPELVQYFLKSAAASMGVPPRRVGSDAMAVLKSHDLARKHSPAQKQCRTVDDPRAWRPKRRNLGLDASGGGWRARAGGAERHRRREIAKPSATRRAGSLRAGLSGGSNQPLWRQHIPNRRVHWYGALRASSKAEVSRSSNSRDAAWIVDGSP